MADVRLIDANELISYFESWQNLNRYYHGKPSKDIPYSEVISLINSVESIDFNCYKDMANITICGYRASDLVIFAERMRSPERVADIDNDILMDNNKAYIDGYNKAHQEIQEQIDRICKNIGGFESD